MTPAMPNNNDEHPRERLQRKLQEIQSYEAEFEAKNQMIFEQFLSELAFLKEYSRLCQKSFDRYFDELGDTLPKTIQLMFDDVYQLFEYSEKLISANLDQFQMNTLAEDMDLNEAIFCEPQEGQAVWHPEMEEVRNNINQPLERMSDKDVQSWTQSLERLLVDMIERIQQLQSFESDITNVMMLAQDQLIRSETVMALLDEHEFDVPVQEIQDNQEHFQVVWRSVNETLDSFLSMIKFLQQEIVDDQTKNALSQFNEAERTEQGYTHRRDPIEFCPSFDHDHSDDDFFNGLMDVNRST